MNTLTPTARDFLRLHRELATVQEAKERAGADVQGWRDAMYDGFIAELDGEPVLVETAPVAEVPMRQERIW